MSFDEAKFMASYRETYRQAQKVDDATENYDVASEADPRAREIILDAKAYLQRKRALFDTLEESYSAGTLTATLTEMLGELMEVNRERIEIDRRWAELRGTGC